MRQNDIIIYARQDQKHRIHIEQLQKTIEENPNQTLFVASTCQSRLDNTLKIIRNLGYDIEIIKKEYSGMVIKCKKLLKK